MTEQTKNWYQVVIVLQVILLSCCQDNEIISMSTTACDPSLEDCNCLDTQPPTMTLTCPLIAQNNLCDLPTVADEDYCQLSCGTCGKCSTTMLGCQCLSQWEFEGETYSGCENPDNDDAGSWCEINQESCSGQVYKPKKYDYCTEDCSVLQLGNMTQQLSRVSLTTQQDTNPAPPEENESVRETVAVGVVTLSQVVLVNLGNTIVNITGWYLQTSRELLEFKKEEGEGVCTKTVLQPQDKIVIGFGNYDSQGIEDSLKDDCSLSSILSTNYVSLANIFANVVSKVDLTGEMSYSSLNKVLSYCLQNGEYVTISKQFCEYLS